MIGDLQKIGLTKHEAYLRPDQIPVFIDRVYTRENVILNYWRVYGTPEELIVNFALVRGIQAARSYIQKHYPDGIKQELLKQINTELKHNIEQLRQLQGGLK